MYNEVKNEKYSYIYIEVCLRHKTEEISFLVFGSTIWKWDMEIGV